MKKIVVLVLSLCLLLTFAGCEFGSNKGGDKTSKTESKEEKKILALITDYTVNGTNGFDYSSEQTYGELSVNKHTVSVRLNADGTEGARAEYKKTLNEGFSSGMFSEVQATAYYRNGKIATYRDDAWVWQDGSLDLFASVKISDFAFDIESFGTLTVEGENEKTMTFSIPDEKASELLKTDAAVKNLTFVVRTDASETKLLSLTAYYTQTQSATETTFCFVPYYGEVTLDLPQ